MKRFALATVLVALVSMASAAPAANATVTFDGLCTIEGRSWFGKPVALVAQEMDWGFDSFPDRAKCTGLLNGELVVDTPISVVVDGRGLISCGTAGGAIRSEFEGVFHAIRRGDNKLKGLLTLIAPAANNLMFVEGDQGGYATGRASMLGQNDHVAVALGCVEGGSVTGLNFTVTVKTAGPLSG